MTATQPKYLVVQGADDEGKVHLFDRNAGKVVTSSKEPDGVWADTLATYVREGELKLLGLDDVELEAKTVLPTAAA